MKYKKCFLHVDMDAFFASVEQRDNPELKGKPVIIGGLPGEPRSVVSTASYEARKFGVHSAMPVSQAVKLCPDGIYMHGNHHRYCEISSQIMDILRKYSPDVNQLSIDEASVDITGTELLFGKPDELAKKIQQDIFDSTGLTVSIGLASSAYLAKLSSEVNKPNGFYCIHPGDEEKFMLNLPLQKVWGIGSKTVEKLHNAGLFTTKQIHNHSVETLKKIMGEATGNFLYNVVRGIYNEIRTESSHSISAETTFPLDIADIYTAETKLMELAHSVMFRLKKEKSCSRTVMIKIRYNDFSTLTAQYTSSDYISTIEDFFQNARILFEKKYEKGRGIRLLGIGLENIESENSQKQEVLFDFGSKKKQAVEDAILRLSQKHPEIKIKKARLFDSSKNLLLLLAISTVLFFASGTKLYSQQAESFIESDGAASMTSPFTLIKLPEESERTILERKLGNNTIEFIAEGWWQGAFSGGITVKKEDDDSAEISGQTPVFKQQVDMSLWFMLNKQWYFQTSFADEFNKNTLAAGFYGKETNPLKEVKIANRGIIFPDYYSINKFNRGIGGGDNQAPGIISHFESPMQKKWVADFAVRYDMIEQHSATYYGNKAVSNKSIALKNYISGQFFVLPAETGLITKIKNIYIENSNGTHTDRYRRKYKKLSADEYISIKSKNLLVLSRDSGCYEKNGRRPSIIVEFSEPLSKSDFGSYEDDNSFLGEIQNFFGKHIRLSDFGYDFFTEIDGKSAILIQNSTGFSPFLVAKYYDCGISSDADITLGSTSSSEKIDGWNAQITEDFANFMSSSFYNHEHIYGQIYSEKHTKSLQSISPEERYPMADKLPGIYLGYDEPTDIQLIVQTYNPATNIEIGTNAAKESVRVYINGIIDSDAEYNKENGTVHPSSTISDTDKVYITWNEDSGSIDRGVLAAQASYMYNITPSLKADVSAVFYWPLNPYSNFAEYNLPSNGYATIETGISYTGNYIKTSNALSATVENQNINGLYRIDGMENAVPKTFYLDSNSGSILKNETIPVLKEKKLEYENRYEISEDSIKGLKDSLITGYKIPMEWNFTDENVDNWAAVNVKLPAGYLLSSGTEFRIALKNEISDLKDYDLYIQLGIDGGDDQTPDFQEKLPCWKLTAPSDKEIKSGFNPKKYGWQIIQIYLDDKTRSSFQSYHDMRLIAVSRTKSKGLVCIGPYEIITQGVFTAGSSKMQISSEQIEDNTIPDRKKFNKDKNYVQQIKWSAKETFTSSSESFISAAKYFPVTDFNRYRNLEFFYKLDASESFPVSEELKNEEYPLTITLDKDSESLESEGKTAIKLQLSKEAVKIFQSNKKIWHTFSIDLYEKKVSIDGFALPDESYWIYLNKTVNPTRFKIQFPTIDCEKNRFIEGNLQIDEIALNNTSPYFLIQDYADFEVKKQGTVISVKGFPLVENASFKTQQNFTTMLETDSQIGNDVMMSNITESELTVAGVRIQASLATSTKQYKGISSASHEFSAAIPILDILSFSDRYVYNYADTAIEKKSMAQLDLKKFDIPLILSAEVSDSQNKRVFNSGFSSSANLAFAEKFHNLTFSAGISAEQKNIPDSEKIEALESENYFSEYISSTKECFDDGKSDASQRTVKNNISVCADFFNGFLRPTINFETAEKYYSSSNTKYIDSISLRSEFPFTFYKQNFVFAYTKNGGTQEITEKGGSFGKDLNTLYANLYDHRFVFTNIPFYELFDSGCAEHLSDKKNDSETFENMNYSGNYEFSWKRQIFADIKDLYIPSNFSFEAQRSITISADTSDIYILKTSVINTPFNIFQKTLKKRYKSDEHIFSLTGTARIPASSSSENSLYTLSTYIQSGFYFNENDFIRTAIEFQLQTDGNWNSNFSANYKRDSYFSPIVSLCKIAYRRYDYSKLKMQRTNGIDIKILSKENKITQTYEINHKLDLDFSKYISLNFGASVSAEHDDKNVFTLNVTGSAGGKIKF